jgi:hypothetical protein
MLHLNHGQDINQHSEGESMKIKVNFRKYSDGDIVALFPTIPWGRDTCTSYMHIGQHGDADYDYCLMQTKPATKEEYTELYDELIESGYELQPIKRYTRLAIDNTLK